MSRASRLALCLVLAFPLAVHAEEAAAQPQARTRPATEPRTLFIVVDAVPYDVVGRITDRELGDEAHFRDFKPPVRLISTFPSSTSVALGGIMESIGVVRSPGYEAHFFDWQTRKVRGGGPVSYYKIGFGWREFFDWSRKGPVGSSFEAVRPIRSGLKRLRKAVRDFVTNDRDVFYVYVAATDSVAHIQGPSALDRFMIGIEEIIIEARRADPERPFEVIIFSDHGIAGGDEPLKNTLKVVKRVLKQGGFKLRKRLEKPGDLVLTPFGLVSSFEVYVAQEETARAARILAGVEGVELCVRHEADRWVVEGAAGRADARRREREGRVEWAYEEVTGDPLSYAVALESIAPWARSDEVWVADEALLDATMDHHFPDALHRFSRAFDLVDNPASILCSIAEGYMYGPKSTDLLARFGKGRLKWTHGALTRAETMGFVLTDAEDFDQESPVRFDRALDFFVRRYTDRGESAYRPE